MAFITPYIFPGQICPETEGIDPNYATGAYLQGLRYCMATIWLGGRFSLSGSASWTFENTPNNYTYSASGSFSFTFGESVPMSSLMCLDFHSIDGSGNFETSVTETTNGVSVNSTGQATANFSASSYLYFTEGVYYMPWFLSISSDNFGAANNKLADDSPVIGSIDYLMGSSTGLEASLDMYLSSAQTFNGVGIVTSSASATISIIEENLPF